MAYASWSDPAVDSQFTADINFPANDGTTASGQTQIMVGAPDQKAQGFAAEWKAKITNNGSSAGTATVTMLEVVGGELHADTQKEQSVTSIATLKLFGGNPSGNDTGTSGKWSSAAYPDTATSSTYTTPTSILPGVTFQVDSSVSLTARGF